MTNTEIYNLAIAQNINPSLANVIRLADFIEIGINGVVCHFNDPDECDVFVGVIVPEQGLTMDNDIIYTIVLCVITVLGMFFFEGQSYDV